MMPSRVAPTCLSHPFALGEPRRRRREADTPAFRENSARANFSRRCAPLDQRLIDQRVPFGVSQQVEGDEQRRRLRGQLCDAARPRDESAAAAHRTTTRRLAARRSRHRARSCRGLSFCAAPRRPRGSSASAAGRISTAVRPCRRRERRGSGSRPTSARIATPDRPESSSTDWASIGSRDERRERGMKRSLICCSIHQRKRPAFRPAALRNFLSSRIRPRR